METNHPSFQQNLPEQSSNQRKISSPLLLLKFLQKLKLFKIIKKETSDPRNNHIVYSLYSLFMMALSTVLFRNKSKHAFESETRQLSSHPESIIAFLLLPAGSVPTTKTVDDVLTRICHGDIDRVLFSLFKELIRSKFFLNHSQLLPQSLFHLAIDAETIHTYSDNDAHVKKPCPYCLKREYGKQTRYHHVCVVASIVCPGKIRIPIFVYPVHAKAVRYDISSCSDVGFKQECELSAFYQIIPIIRQQFPRLRFCVLLDSLYANGPVMKCLWKHRMEFMIVRKPGCMKSVGQDCDGLLKLKEQRNNNHFTHTPPEGNTEKYDWFNDIEYQDLHLNVLRFEEWKEGKRLSKWEWLVSWPLDCRNVAATAARGRMRWLEEDVFNSLEERGFEIHHDYSRDGPTQFIWVRLILIAYFITELFTISEAAKALRKGCAIKTWMQDILSQLIHRAIAELFDFVQLLKRKQFRYIITPMGP